MPRPVSRAQARLFGAIAGGAKISKARGLSRREAKNLLRGVKVKRLPARSRKSR